MYEALSRRTTDIVRFECGTFESLYDDCAFLETTGRVAYDPVIEACLVAVRAPVGNSGLEGKMAETASKRGIPRYIIVAGVILIACVVAAGVTLFLRDRNEKEMLSQLERSQVDLRMLGGQIANIKDADLTSANDFISAYAQIEPLEKEYEVKLQQFSELYEQARERDSHRGWLDLERLRGRHHPETWEKMSEIIGLVREINEITKRQISIVHAMASLPEPERMRFWHEQFMPLAAQEHALREQLQVVGQGRTPDAAVQ